MFDQQEFSNILINISKKYNSISEFAEKSTVGRSYLSKYIHKKINAPPSPKVLKKIADNSKGVVTYENLMVICGYQQMEKEYELLLKGDIKYADLFFDGDKLTTSEQINKINNLVIGLKGYITSCQEVIKSIKNDNWKIASIQNYEKEIERTQKIIDGFEKIKKQLEEK